MTYENTTVRDLYTNNGTYNASEIEKAMLWVEAENIATVWKVVKKWFDYMQSGEATQRFPDPTWHPKPGRRALTPEVASQIVTEMDDDFRLERGRFPKESGLGPDFERLPSHARVAFCQEVYDILKTTEEIMAEAETRLQAGEHLPPPL